MAYWWRCEADCWEAQAVRESRQRAEKRSKGHLAAGELPDGLGVMKHSLFAGAACVDDGKEGGPRSLF